jgi:hypothetical protein
VFQAGKTDIAVYFPIQNPRGPFSGLFWDVLDSSPSVCIANQSATALGEVRERVAADETGTA